MINDRQIDQKREDLDALIKQSERQLMVQIDPYIASRRGVDFGEYFYNLRSQLTSKIFSEESLSNTEFRKGLEQNVQDIIRENYEEILQKAVFNVRGENIHDAKHYVNSSYNDMLQQVQDLMQNVRDIMSSRSTVQEADGARLLQEADRVIAQVSGEIAGHKINLENLWAQLNTMVKSQEAKKEEEDRKQQEESQQQGDSKKGQEEETKPQEVAGGTQEQAAQLSGAQMLRDIDELLASTDELIAEKTGDLTRIENQIEVIKAKKEEERKQAGVRQQGELANPASILASVEELIADTDKFIAAQESNLAGFKNQLREYVEKHQVQEVDRNVESRNSDRGQADAFRLSDEDMKKFNKGVQEVMRARSESTPDAKPSREEDLSK